MTVAALAPFLPTGLRPRAPSRLRGPVLVSVVVHVAAVALGIGVSVRAARERVDQRAIRVFLQPPSGPVAPIRAPAPPAPAPSTARAAPAAPPAIVPPARPHPRDEPRPASPPARRVARVQPADRAPKPKQPAPAPPEALRHVLEHLRPAAGPLVAAAGTREAAGAAAIAANAPQEAAAMGAARDAAAVTFVERVRAAVESVYEIPRGLSGSVLEAALRLRIDRAGRVLARSVEVPSFDPAFDAALLAVVDRIPTVAPPAEIADAVSARGIRVWFRSDDLARGATR